MSGLHYERGRAMAERVRLEAGAHLGVGAGDLLARAVAEALRLRESGVRDDHDSRYLHPARCVLILMSDAASRSADVLAAAAFVESVDSDMTAAGGSVRAAAGAAAATLRDAVPTPLAFGDDELLEALVSAEPDVALIALAERLDQVRHLQFRRELDWAALHRGVEEVYAPVAHRVCPPLGRRFDRWAEAFRRRLLTR